MPQLATNPRTQTKATIKRASARARMQVRNLDARIQQEVERIYQVAAEDLRQAIQSYADNTGTVRLQSLQQLLAQVNNRLDVMAQSRDALLDDALADAASLGVRAYTGAISDAFLTRASDEALRFVSNFIDQDGLQLSDRLWRLNNGAQQMVGDAIKQAVIQGHSASQAVNDFLRRGQPVPADVADKLGLAGADRMARVTGDQLLRADGNARQNALRVFRTEINRAHGEAYMLGGEEHPDFGGWKFLLSPRHPRTDICDMHASVNRYGLGPGVYPTREAVPWPAHPNTLSFVEIVFSDEITDEDRAGKEDRIDWLNRQPGHIQEGVLNSRAKRAALQRDLLRENEIATPWRVLRQRYERRGIDVSDLRPKPEATFTGLPINDMRQEAYEYVVTQGERNGWEYAVVYDVDRRTEFIRKTSRMRRQVSFDRHELAVFMNPRNKLELVHNHPSSNSLSAADLRVATFPGLDSVVAVGHSGTIYRAKSLVSSGLINDAYRTADARVYFMVKAAGEQIGLSAAEVEQLHFHTINLILSRAGLTDYSATNISGPLAEALARFDAQALDDIVDTIAKGLL